MVSVGLCWARVGTTLGLSWAILGYVGTFWAMLDKSWDHIGLVLGHFGLCWDILGHVGAILGSSWAILCYFRICLGLCFGLGHFSVVDFSSVHAGVCKKHQKYQEKIHQKYKEKINLWSTGFCWYFLVVFVSFLGHAAVRLCLPDLGLMLGIVGYVGTFWATLSHFWGILWFLYVSVGFCWARIGTILGSSWAIWAHLGPFWAIFGSVSAFVLDSGMSASLTFRPCKACAKKKQKYQEKNIYNLYPPVDFHY